MLTYSFFIRFKTVSLILILSFLNLSRISAQNDTIFVDQNWKITTKDKAVYYRIKQQNRPIGACWLQRGVKQTYPVNYYYIGTNNLQFEGFSTDENGTYLTGNAKWYNQNGTLTDSAFLSPKKTLDFPLIFDLNYSTANKSLFSAGVELCLNPDSYNKFFLGAGYGITNSYNGNYFGLPDFHLSYNTQYLLFLKGGASTKHAYIVSGLTLFNMMDLGFGYSKPFSDNKIPEIKGFTINITFRLTTKPKKIYTQMKMM